jgi:hypothetical protein
MVKRKRTNNDIQNTALKLKDRATRTTLKPRETLWELLLVLCYVLVTNDYILYFLFLLCFLQIYNIGVIYMFSYFDWKTLKTIKKRCELLLLLLYLLVTNNYILFSVFSSVFSSSKMLNIGVMFFIFIVQPIFRYFNCQIKNITSLSLCISETI